MGDGLGTAAPAVAGRDGRRVYADAYVSRLTEVLAHDFPALRGLLGSEAFNALGRAYVAAQPSTHRSVRWFGKALADFAAAAAPWSGRPEVADLARLEWTLGESFDAGDGCALDPGQLRQIHPGQWQDLTFGFHPAVRRLDTITDAGRLWQQTLGLAPAEPRPDGDRHHWLVWRRDLDLQFRSLSADEAQALDGLRAGLTLADTALALASRRGEDGCAGQLASWLGAWLGAGLLVSLGNCSGVPPQPTAP